MPVAQPLEIPARADRLPERAQQIELDVAVEPFAHVPRRQAAPDDVGEIRRDVIERLRLDQRFVRRRQQREARSEAGAEDADPLVALRRQPRDRPPRVEHRLPAHLHRPRDVGADDVVGAVELGRHPLIVIRQAQTQRAHAVPREQPAQADVAAGVGVPLRQHEHRGAARSRSSLSNRVPVAAPESTGSAPCCSIRAA